MVQVGEEKKKGEEVKKRRTFAVCVFVREFGCGKGKRERRNEVMTSKYKTRTHRF